MAQTALSDEHWIKLKSFLLDAGIYDKPDLRSTFEGMIYRNEEELPLA